MIPFEEKNDFELPNKENKPEFYEDIGIETGYRVFLFNDDIHTFDEVITQLIKAIHCNFEKARSLAFEVHVKGKAMVFFGEMAQCLKVSSILEEIGLHTQIVG
ncbi:MAG: ATP-dependent Clp protease adaptor ClpS [Ignavibacteriales bacterium]|nr:ATP-dependent Clp protease adaptor ClpS [Ignavibacteriales bacterium]